MPMPPPKLETHVVSSRGLSPGPSYPNAPASADSWIPATSAGMTSGVGVDRRSVLAGAVAVSLSAVGAVPELHAQAADPVHRFKLGSSDIIVVSDGTMTLPTAMLLPGHEAGEISKVLSGTAPASILSQVNVTLIRQGGALVLIDAGGGPDFLPSLGRLADNLEKAGIEPDAVTHVVFTHAHPDHLWGVIDPLDGGTMFAKARHLMSAVERDFWLAPDLDKRVPEGLQGISAGTARRVKTLASRLEPMRAGADILPGLAAIDTGGHTPGHCSILLRSGTEQLLIGGDVLGHPLISFAAPDWRWGTDLDADRGAAARRRTLDMLAADKIALVGYHLPWPGVGRVERKDTAFRYVAA